MNELLLTLIWLLLYSYALERLTKIERNWKLRGVVFSLSVFFLVLPFGMWLALSEQGNALLSNLFEGSGASAFHQMLFDGKNENIPLWTGVCGWLLVGVAAFGEALFYGETPLRNCSVYGLLPAILGAVLQPAFRNYGFAVSGLYFGFLFILLEKEERSLQVLGKVCAEVLFLLSSVFLTFWTGKGASVVSAQFGGTIVEAVSWGIVLCQLVLFYLVEVCLWAARQRYEKRTQQQNQESLARQFQEIKQVYLNMRGWRHDYHNHLQVIKAKLAMEDEEGLRVFLDALEQELDRVDSFVKSGNLMADAILNSKLSLADTQKIQVSCKAQLPKQLSIDDVDMCVILGNLLDNALEACAKLEAKDRFLRIYLAVRKCQLYMSVQNSAKQELGFEQRHYISTKRGNHGLGMKRVQTVVDKYDGFLRLANEPGIFAAEVTLPLEAQQA